MTLTARLISYEQVVDGRRRVRRRVEFDARILAAPGPADVLIHNISESGLMLECAAELALGDAIDVDLPQAGSCQAIVVWRNDGLYGCRFDTPLSSAAISAALLRSAAALPGGVAKAPDESRPATHRPRAGRKLSLQARFWIIFLSALAGWALVGLVVWGLARLLG